ncbi:NnrU family protein [Paracoccaceae bacterium Fryx2]|nr:NnrU family protein [Paracoccaceae bacterium Fryx2]
MAGWGMFGLAFAVFLLSHAIPTRPAVKARLKAVAGPRGYLFLYSAVSLAVLAWLIVAAARAPFVPLWDPATWHRWAANLAMPLAIALATLSVGVPNPLSFGGPAAGFRPDRPGIIGLTRHPLLWALALWAGAHLLANGDLAHVLLFGSFTGFALLGMAIIDRRNRRLMGAAEWARLAQATAVLPLAALLSGRWRPVRGPSAPRLLLAVAIWAALILAHPWVIGLSPLP